MDQVSCLPNRFSGFPGEAKPLKRFGNREEALRTTPMNRGVVSTICKELKAGKGRAAFSFLG
jgi:hypothetical protein